MLMITGFIEIARNYLVWHRNRFSNLALGRCLNRAALIISASIAFSMAVEAGTDFYVDADWSGRHNGTASKPFAVLDRGAWGKINKALATNDVTIYFSALKPDGVTQQSKAWYVHCARTDYGTSRLTLDGYSKYNSSLTMPNWLSNPEPNIAVAYLTGKVFKIAGDGSQALGWGRRDGGDFVSNGGQYYCCIESHRAAADNEPGVGANWTKYWDQHGSSGAAWASGRSYKCLVKQNNITLRGFEITGAGARSSFNGDNFIWEFNYVHDITGLGAAVTFLYHSFPDSSLAQTISAPTSNETMRHFKIVNTFGEAVYVGALNPDSTEAFETLQGNQRNGVTITDFYISGSGINGGQGDGIDCKHGIVSLHIADGEIGHGTGTGNGINLPETVTNVSQGNLIERVFIHDFDAPGGGGRGITGSTDGTRAAPLYSHAGVTIRNCIVANAAGAFALGFSGSTGHPITNCSLYNNTVYNCGGPIGISTLATGCNVKNNFVFANTVNPRGNTASSGVISDYNAHDGTWISANEGTHTLALSSADALAAVVNAAGQDFHLSSSSVLRGKAITVASFSDDLYKTVRVSGDWDIGAVGNWATGAVHTSGARPAAPHNLLGGP